MQLHNYLVDHAQRHQEKPDDDRHEAVGLGPGENEASGDDNKLLLTDLLRRVSVGYE